MKFCVFIWPIRNGYFAFIDVAKVFNETLNNMGHDSIIDNQTIHNDRKYIVFGANEVLSKPVELPKNSILVNLEQMEDGSVWVNDKYLNLLKQHEVWDYSNNNIRYLQGKGITNIKKIELGYGKTLETNPQDIDVLFIGSMNQRRLSIQNQIMSHPQLVGKIIIFKSNVHGNEKMNLIHRAKIVLNIHYYESKILEVVRISQLLANKKCVISEKSLENEVDDKWKEGVIICDSGEIPNNIVYYLQHEEFRKEQELKGYNFMKNNPQQLPL